MITTITTVGMTTEPPPAAHYDLTSVPNNWPALLASPPHNEATTHRGHVDTRFADHIHCSLGTNTRSSGSVRSPGAARVVRGGRSRHGALRFSAVSKHPKYGPIGPQGVIRGSTEDLR